MGCNDMNCSFVALWEINFGCNMRDQFRMQYLPWSTCQEQFLSFLFYLSALSNPRNALTCTHQHPLMHQTHPLTSNWSVIFWIVKIETVLLLLLHKEEYLPMIQLSADSAAFLIWYQFQAERFSHRYLVHNFSGFEGHQSCSSWGFLVKV